MCFARISAIRRVIENTSAWISMSAGVPRKPAEPWWIIIFAFGSAIRSPGAPPASTIAAADIPIPTQIVLNVRLHPLLRVVDCHAGAAEPPGEFT